MSNKKIFVGIAVIVLAIVAIIAIATYRYKTTPVPAPETGKTFTSADVASHSTASSCYSSVNGSVYDLTGWISQHPGGSQAIIGLCGKDGTSAFLAQHGGQGDPEAELASLKIGTLSQ